MSSPVRPWQLPLSNCFRLILPQTPRRCPSSYYTCVQQANNPHPRWWKTNQKQTHTPTNHARTEIPLPATVRGKQTKTQHMCLQIFLLNKCAHQAYGEDGPREKRSLQSKPKKDNRALEYTPKKYDNKLSKNWTAC